MQEYLRDQTQSIKQASLETPEQEHLNSLGQTKNVYCLAHIFLSQNFQLKFKLPERQIA